MSFVSLLCEIGFALLLLYIAVVTFEECEVESGTGMPELDCSLVPAGRDEKK